MSAPFITRRIVTSADLEQAGFSDTQIDQLDAMARCYPFIEFTDSIEEWQRLVFLKWRRGQGHLAD
jgi:hypothetical protein